MNFIYLVERLKSLTVGRIVKSLHFSQRPTLTPTLSHWRGSICAFTLAEVLITLGIIGIVAAMTLPTLIVNHQKKVTVTRLQAFNTIMSQALNSARNDYGDMNYWDNSGLGQTSVDWLNKYVLPYIKHAKVYIDEDSNLSVVELSNGSGFSFKESLFFFCTYYKDCKKEAHKWNSRNRFIFRIYKSENRFGAYYIGNNFTREKIIDSSTTTGHGCNHLDRNYGYCAKLIEYDGWQMKDDYPW